VVPCRSGIGCNFRALQKALFYFLLGSMYAFAINALMGIGDQAIQIGSFEATTLSQDELTI
jgi:hypothetical protein